MGRILEMDVETYLTAGVDTQDDSYTIGSRALTRANLTDIRNAIDYWNSNNSLKRNSSP